MLSPTEIVIQVTGLIENAEPGYKGVMLVKFGLENYHQIDTHNGLHKLSSSQQTQIILGTKIAKLQQKQKAK